VKRLDFY